MYKIQMYKIYMASPYRFSFWQENNKSTINDVHFGNVYVYLVFKVSLFWNRPCHFCLPPAQLSVTSTLTIVLFRCEGLTSLGFPMEPREGFRTESV